MIRLVPILPLLLLSSAAASSPLSALFSPSSGPRLSLGVDAQGGIGKTRDRLFVQPWNFTTSAELGCQLRLFHDYGLTLRAGYTYFKDQPEVLNWIPEEAYRAELEVQEVSISLSQTVSPFPFVWLEQGVALLFPVHTVYDLYRSNLAADGWTDFEFYSSEELDRDFYRSYPLVALVHSAGLDISRIWRGRVPLSLYYRQEMGLVPMYLGDNLFAAIGREQHRLCWGLRSMIVKAGKPAPVASMSEHARTHNIEFGVGVGGGVGNLQSVVDSKKFHYEGMARVSARAAYVYQERYRLSLEALCQFRQYTESEYNYDYGSYAHWPDDIYRDDYFHDHLSYLGGAVSLDILPVRGLFVGAGLGLAWVLGFGDQGWRYVEADSGDGLIESHVSDPHERYDYSADPFLLVKCGTPLYQWSAIPLELDLTWQWGWRCPDIATGFYTVTRPAFASISLGVTYVFRAGK